MEIHCSRESLQRSEKKEALLLGKSHNTCKAKRYITEILVRATDPRPSHTDWLSFGHSSQHCLLQYMPMMTSLSKVTVEFSWETMRDRFPGEQH